MDGNARGDKAGQIDAEMHCVGCRRPGFIRGQSEGEWRGGGEVGGIGLFFCRSKTFTLYAFFCLLFSFFPYSRPAGRPTGRPAGRQAGRPMSTNV